MIFYNGKRILSQIIAGKSYCYAVRRFRDCLSVFYGNGVYPTNQSASQRTLKKLKKGARKTNMFLFN